MNTTVISGRLTRDVEFKHYNGGTSARFTVAVDRNLSKEKKNEFERNGQPTADFINCVAFGNLAETIKNYTAKGLRVQVQGRIQTGSYQNNQGQTVYTTDVLVQNIEFIDWKDSQDIRDDFEEIEERPRSDRRLPF